MARYVKLYIEQQHHMIADAYRSYIASSYNILMICYDQVQD